MLVHQVVLLQIFESVEISIQAHHYGNRCSKLYYTTSNDIFITIKQEQNTTFDY